MRCEARPTSYDFRVYEGEEGYEQGAEFIFVVRGNVAADRLFMSAGLLKDSATDKKQSRRRMLQVRRAIEIEVKRLGYSGADWTRLKVADGEYVEIPVSGQAR